MDEFAITILEGEVIFVTRNGIVGFTMVVVRGMPNLPRTLNAEDSRKLREDQAKVLIKKFIGRIGHMASAGFGDHYTIL